MFQNSLESLLYLQDDMLIESTTDEKMGKILRIRVNYFYFCRLLKKKAKFGKLYA